jgi:hypothetical protein
MVEWRSGHFFRLGNRRPGFESRQGKYKALRKIIAMLLWYMYVIFLIWIVCVLTWERHLPLKYFLKILLRNDIHLRVLRLRNWAKWTRADLSRHPRRRHRCPRTRWLWRSWHPLRRSRNQSFRPGVNLINQFWPVIYGQIFVVVKYESLNACIFW